MSGRTVESTGGARSTSAAGGVRCWLAPRLRAALGDPAAKGPEAARGPDRASSRAADGAAELLERIFRHEPERFLRRMPGRETFAWPVVLDRRAAGEVEQVLCKRLRGDESRDWWYERVRLRPPRSAARRECENLIGLRAAGLPVPEPLGWIEEPRALRLPGRAARVRGGRSVCLMEHVPHEVDLIELLEGARRSERDHWLAVLAALVARLHDAGWYHRDLYLGHLVLAAREGGPGVVLLDAGRARHEHAPRRRWLVKDLAALLLTTPRAVGRSERLRFLRAYLDRRGLEGGARRRSWVRAVLLKAQLLASHRPRHVDPPSEIDRRLGDPSRGRGAGGAR